MPAQRVETMFPSCRKSERKHEDALTCELGFFGTYILHTLASLEAAFSRRQDSLWLPQGSKNFILYCPG